MVQSDVGYATQVSTKPWPIWSSSRNDWSDWSMVPETTLPAHELQAPARHEVREVDALLLGLVEDVDVRRGTR